MKLSSTIMTSEGTSMEEDKKQVQLLDTNLKLATNGLARKC